MILVVKGSTAEVLNAIWQRGFTALKMDQGSDECYVVELCEPFDMETVVAWYVETSKIECKPGVGYPPGTLMAYSGSNVVCGRCGRARSWHLGQGGMGMCVPIEEDPEGRTGGFK